MVRFMNQIDLKEKNAIVTGGARGIGLAIAERLLASGANVSLWDRDQKTLDSTAKSLAGKGRVHVVSVDISNPDSVKAAGQRTISDLKRVDILVNNAGIAGVTKKLWEFTPAEWQEVLQVNLFGVFLCCHALVPHMIENKYGRIVNIASIAGKEGNPNASHYSAAKAGVIALTKSLAKEVATTGILVNCITPAVIETDILKQVTQQHIDYMLSKIPMGRFGLKEEAAALVAWLCSADCSFSTGAAFDLSGGRATY
jgi:NAD(P)-dependent dehydrogenase (short-subunit alcohol dehydrogenase family)